MNQTNRHELRGTLPRLTTRTPDFRLFSHGLTDVGCRREANEDSFLIMPKNALFIVADGMGGHAGGQVASKLTIKNVAQQVLKRLSEAEKQARATNTNVIVSDVLREGISDACAMVFDYATEHPALTGMGSTVTALLIYKDLAWIGQVGDSRAYLIRDNLIHQVTEDHSLVQEQVAAGLITPEQAKMSAMRNIITRSIGFEREVKVDTLCVPLCPGDRFILCSDGLTGHVEDLEICDTVLDFEPPSVPRHLIRMANERGGDDNCTVVMVGVQTRRGRA